MRIFDYFARGDNKSLKNRAMRTAFLITCAVIIIGIFVLNVFYVPECDEYYFTQWRFSSLWNRIMTKPSEDAGYVIGVMHNGRVLGNLLGVAQSSLVFGGLSAVRALIFTAGIVLLAYLMARYAFEDRRIGFIVSLALLVCTRNGFYANVWSWGVAYVNYVLPAIGYLTVSLLVFSSSGRSGKKAAAACAATFAVAFATELFSEPFTAAMMLFAVLLLFFKDLPLAARLSASSGFIIGGLCMFLNPEYRLVMSGDSIHTVSWDAQVLFENFGKIFMRGYFKNLVVPLLICVFLLIRLWSCGKKAASVVVCAVSAAAAVTAYLVNEYGDPSPLFFVICGVLLLASWLCGCLLIPRGRTRTLAVFNLIFSFVSVVPEVVSDGVWSERMFFTCYIFQCAVLILLFPEKKKIRITLAAVSAVLCAVWIVRLIPVYSENYRVNEERIEYGQSQVDAGADEITLPLLPNLEFATNEHAGKGDMCLIIYREQPFDVKLKFVPYEQFYKESSD